MQQPLVGLWQQVVRRSLPSPPPPMMEQPPPLRDGESRLINFRAGSGKSSELKSKFSYDAAAKFKRPTPAELPSLLRKHLVPLPSMSMQLLLRSAQRSRRAMNRRLALRLEKMKQLTMPMRRMVGDGRQHPNFPQR